MYGDVAVWGSLLVVSCPIQCIDLIPIGVASVVVFTVLVFRRGTLATVSHSASSKGTQIWIELVEV